MTNYREQTEKKNPVYAIVGYLTLALLLAGALSRTCTGQVPMFDMGWGLDS